VQTTISVAARVVVGLAGVETRPGAVLTATQGGVIGEDLYPE